MNIKPIIVAQYRAPLQMLRQAIDFCPETLWLEGSPNRYWHIAYHALFYTHFYLSPTDADFVAWEHHRPEYNFLGAVPWKPKEQHVVDQAYTRTELISYADQVAAFLEERIATLDLEAPSGFHWLPFNKLELQFYSIRHVQHHTGQLADRLRTSAGIGLAWVR